MKRIKSKSSEANKKRRNQIVIGIILIIVMFGSVFGVIVGSFGKEESNSKIEYNGFEFIPQSDSWILPMGDFNFIFQYNPNEVEEIETDVKYLNNYAGKPLYLSSENSEATYEIATNLESVVLRMQNACLNDTIDCQDNFPTKDCTNNFIIIQADNSTSIVQQDNCVFIQGPYENLTKISDEFLFNILGVR